MIFTIEETPSDSPFVERIWRAHSERDGMFLSIAMSHWEMVVTRNLGKTTLTLRGPETKATPLYCPSSGEWLGIRFKLGTLLPYLPASNLVDVQDYLNDLLFTPDALLMGKKTYEFFAQVWPSRQGKDAEQMNSIPKYVASRTLQEPLQ